LTAYKAVADARALHLAGRYRGAISKLHDAVRSRQTPPAAKLGAQYSSFEPLPGVHVN
jgi:hypothetical protein